VTRRRPPPKKPKPRAAIAQFIDLEISDLSRGGAGVGRDETGRVVFVPFTAPGDRLRVRIVEENKRYATGVLGEIIQPSPVRVKPPCPVFGKCGGCQWQHIPYEIQWKTKMGGVRQALQRVSVELPTDFTEFPAQTVWNYRNRVQLRGFQSKMGFYAPKSHDIISIDQCPIAKKEINDSLEQVREEGFSLERPYKVEVEALPDGSVRKTWNAAHGSAGFRQVHDEQNTKLQSWIAKNVTPGRELFDLFGGSGNLSVSIASRMSQVHCVDVGAPSSRPQGTPDNVQFHPSPVLPWLMKWKNPTGSIDSPRSAISDPPREGLGQEFTQISARLAQLNVKELIAVGCDPDSWARDVSQFIKLGWRFEAAAVLDFFPQTPHVESVALLRV